MPRKKPVEKKKLQHKENKPWEPDAKQFEMYRMWCEDLMSFAEIGRQQKPELTRFAVRLSVIRTAEWIKADNYDNIMRFRTRQTTTLEHVAQTALQCFRKSRGVIRVKVVESGTSAGEHGGAWDKTSMKFQRSQGNPAFLSELRGALKDIRDMWGVNAAVKQEIEVKNQNEIDDLPGPHEFASEEEFLRATAAAVSKLADDCRNSA